MRLVIALVLIALALTGCATPPPPEPIIETVEVRVPVPLSCVPDRLGSPPDYVDDDAGLRAAPDAAARYVLLQVGREQRRARLAKLESVVGVCRNQNRPA